MPARRAGFWRPGDHQDSAQTFAEKQKNRNLKQIPVF